MALSVYFSQAIGGLVVGKIAWSSEESMKRFTLKKLEEKEKSDLSFYNLTLFSVFIRYPWVLIQNLFEVCMYLTLKLREQWLDIAAGPQTVWNEGCWLTFLKSLKRSVLLKCFRKAKEIHKFYFSLFWMNLHSL